jgi:hypothetical protein
VEIIIQVLLAIFLAGIFFMREDKQKILEHVLHGKLLKLFLIFFLYLQIQSTLRYYILYFSASFI